MTQESTPNYSNEEFARILAEEPEEESLFTREEPILFGIFIGDPGEDSFYTERTFVVCFSPQSFWDDHGYIPDEAVYDELTGLGFMLPEYLNEEAENMNVVDMGSVTYDEIVDDLVALGFVFSDEITTFLNA